MNGHAKQDIQVYCLHASLTPGPCTDTHMHTRKLCGGTGTDSTVPTNPEQVLITTGTVTDSGSEYTGFIGVISGYLYTRQVNCERWPVDRPHGWNAGLTCPNPPGEGGV